MITPQASFRRPLAVSFDRWQSVVMTAGGPVGLFDATAWGAAGDLSGLALAMLGQESNYGTAYADNSPANLNPLNLRPRGGLPGFQRFGSYAEGVREWRNRILDPAYAYKDAQTIAELIAIYAPSSENDPAGYAADVVARLNAWGVTQGGSPTVPDVHFGRVPKPPIVELICAKAGDRHGYYQLSHPRRPVGVCEHVTDGYGSIEFYHRFFGIGGERADDALVDFVVGRDGRIGMLNDPFGSRAPWANGSTDGLEGDGPAFLARFPGELDPANERLVSIEHEGRANDDWTGAQWNASVALDAWLFDQLKVRYDSFPVNQNVGVVTHLLHSEFTGKGGNALLECPGRYLKQNIDRFQAAVKALMMAHQVDANPQTKPPSVPWGRDATGPQTIGKTACLAYLGMGTARRPTPVTNHIGKGARTIYTIDKDEPVLIRGGTRSGGVGYVFVEIAGKGVGRARWSAFKERWPLP